MELYSNHFCFYEKQFSENYMIINYDKCIHLIFIFMDHVRKKLQNARLIFQNVFESNEGKLIQLAMLNKTDNPYTCLPCEILSKYLKWQLFQFNKLNPNFFVSVKFLLGQISGFTC